MQKNKLLGLALGTALLSFSFSANAGFSGPFNWFDNNDGYKRYDYRGGPGYGRDRWRRYDRWEPNYWRYRYFDDNSNDFIPDRFNDHRRYRRDRRYRPDRRRDNRYRRDRSRYYGYRPSRMSETPQAKHEREQMEAKQPAECR